MVINDFIRGNNNFPPIILLGLYIMHIMYNVYRRLGVKTRHSKKSTFQERQKTIFLRNLTTSVIEVVVIG